MKGHYALFGLAALGLLGLAFYLGRTGQAPVTPGGGDSQAGSGYDYEASGVSVEQTDEAGRRLYAFTAEQVRQQAGAERLDARNLTLRYDPPAEASGPAQHWTVRADTARLPQQGGVLALAGNVEARGIPPGAEATLTVRTDTLDYDMRGEKLHTDEPVRFEWNGRELAGTGLDADLRLGQFELKSDVRGRVSF